MDEFVKGKVSKRSVTQVAHGIHPTGGYFYDVFLFKTLCMHYHLTGEGQFNQYKSGRYYSGFGHFKFAIWCWKKVNANINIVSHWIALFAFIKILFTKQKVLFVWHHHDEQEVKTFAGKVYYKVLMYCIRHIYHPRFALVVVSPFWRKRMLELTSDSHIEVLYFPNLFDPSKYIGYRTAEKRKQIYLGKHAHKNDPQLFQLANQLSALGYACFFSTINSDESAVHPSYEVKHFADEADYLKAIAGSMYTVIWVNVAEGWNRTAHESILVGTTVIGSPMGGLGNLLEESQSFEANTINEFLSIITSGVQQKQSDEFIAKYDTLHVASFMAPLLKWLDA